MSILPRSLTFTRIALLLVCITALAMLSWACSSGPEIVDPTSTAEALPTNTLVPPSTSAPTDTPTTDTPPLDSTLGAQPTTRDWNVLGSPDASVSIADFGDFMWPGCRHWARGAALEVKKAYVETGLVNLNYFHFPHINDDSYLAAHATECAGEQGSFWQYHDNLYEKQGEGGRGLERLEGFAEDLGLDTGRFSACMEARTYDGVIQRDINLALRNEVSVTPTIFVLSTDPNQTGTKFDGSPSFEEISAVIDELLATPVPTPSPAPALAPTPTSESTPPEPTPTSLPSDTLTPAPTPSPTPVPTPTPTAVPTPSPTPVPTPEPVPSGRTWNILGSAAAPVTLEEFSDFQWGICRSWALGPAQEIKQKYIDQGQVKLVLRHRTSFGPASKIMSLGTECAGEQDKFWEFHDARIRNGSSNVAGQISLAGDLGLNASQFTACMEEERYQTFLAEDRAAAQTYGVFTQPAFIISSGGESTKRIGWQSAAQLSAIFDEYLN